MTQNQALKSFRGKTTSSEEIDNEINDMKAELGAQSSGNKMSLLELMKSKQLRRPLEIAVVLHLSQQLSGINSVFYYSTIIFESAGISGDNAKIATVGIGSVMVLMTLVSIPLMESLGRRSLHIVGLAGMFFSAILLTFSLIFQEKLEFIKYISIVAALLYVMFFAFGPGSVPWLLVSELFTQNSRGSAMSISVFVNWSANFVVGLAYPAMQLVLKNYSFIPFIILLAIFWYYCVTNMPETKGRTFEEISSLFSLPDTQANFASQQTSYGIIQSQQ